MHSGGYFYNLEDWQVISGSTKQKTYFTFKLYFDVFERLRNDMSISNTREYIKTRLKEFNEKNQETDFVLFLLPFDKSKFYSSIKNLLKRAHEVTIVCQKIADPELIRLLKNNISLNEMRVKIVLDKDTYYSIITSDDFGKSRSIHSKVIFDFWRESKTNVELYFVETSSSNTLHHQFIFFRGLNYDSVIAGSANFLKGSINSSVDIVFLNSNNQMTEKYNEYLIHLNKRIISFNKMPSKLIGIRTN